MTNDTERLMTLLAAYLNAEAPGPALTEVESLARDCGIGTDEAYALLLAPLLGLDADRDDDWRLIRACLSPAVREVPAELVTEDPYLRLVGLPEGREGALTLTADTCPAMALFVRDDFSYTPDGGMQPRLGWFRAPVRYPALKERGRLWMTVTPNEIATIRPAAEAAHGRVLTYGLGLGYFVLHALLNPAVTGVTAVERSPEVIALFRRCLLPRFPRPEALSIVRADAFDYAATHGEEFDYVFADLWHDAGDGLPLWHRLRALERPGPEYRYWIEPTMRWYDGGA